MEYYPDQLRYFAALCEALNEFDKAHADEDLHLVIKNGIPIVDAREPDDVYGHIVDEIGGVWSFRPIPDGDDA